MGQDFPHRRHTDHLRGPYRRGRHGRSDTRVDFAAHVIGASIVVGLFVWSATPGIQSAIATSTKTPAEIEKIEQSVYYPRCADARAAGVAPIYQGSPGYREGLDGDHDGIACEPYRGM